MNTASSVSCLITVAQVTGSNARDLGVIGDGEIKSCFVSLGRALRGGFGGTVGIETLPVTQWNGETMMKISVTNLKTSAAGGKRNEALVLQKGHLGLPCVAQS